MDLFNGRILSFSIRIILSLVAGCVLGLERKSRQQVLGMRTLVLISESATLLTILSFYIIEVYGHGSGDPSRVAAQIVSGCGFLGGGAIMRQGLNIKGLTSAAIIWAAAAIGIGIGAGLYIPSFMVLAVVVVGLLLLEKVEDRFFPAARTKTLHLTFENPNINMLHLKEVIEKNGFIISDFNMSKIISINQTIFHYNVKAPKKNDFSDLIFELNRLGKLSEFSITD